MWAVPSAVVLTSGTGQGTTEHEAFDKALLNAGIGDFNLIRLSSVLPVGAKVLLREIGQERIDQLTKGSFLPVVYAVAQSDSKGQLISSAIAIGVPKDGQLSGMIFEAIKTAEENKAAQEAILMVQRAMETRGVSEFETIVISSQVLVNDEIACTVSAAVMLP